MRLVVLRVVASPAGLHTPLAPCGLEGREPDSGLHEVWFARPIGDAHCGPADIGKALLSGSRSLAY